MPFPHSGIRVNQQETRADILSGGSSGASAAAVAAAQAAGSGTYNKAPWLFPTSDARDLNKYGAIALPAVAATATILKFTVPKGRSGLITGIGIDFQANGGAAFVQDLVPFQLLFQLLLNGTPFPGDWAAFNFLPGSVSSPDPLSGLKLRETDQVSLTVTNNVIVVTTQFVGARIRGYLYSKNYDPQSRGAQ